MRRKFDPEQARLSGQRGERLRTPRLDGTIDPLRARASIMEPKVTGPVGLSPVTVRKRGNIEVANLHVGQGRKQLAMLRMAFDIADRVEYDEEGLYWVRRSQQADGTTITTRFNERMQEVVIDSPFPPVPEEEERKPSDITPHPYLWVGMRINFDNDDCMTLVNGWWSVGMVVSEPGENGIIADLADTDWMMDLHYSVFPGTWPGFGPYYPFDVDAQLAEAAGAYPDYYGGDYCFPAGLPGGWTADRFGFFVTESLPLPYISQAMRFSANGGRMYDVRYFADSPDLEYVHGPFDPLNPSYEDVDYRVPTTCYQQLDGDHNTPQPWTSVFVVDPSEGQGMLREPDGSTRRNWPTSNRPADARNLDFILGRFDKTRGDMLVRADDGDNKYVIKFHGIGEECNCGDVYQRPTTVDIEVRSGKEPHMRTLTHRVQINSYTLSRAANWPFGTCRFDYGMGPGTMCDNWWPGAILANVWGDIEVVEYYQPDYLPGGGHCATGEGCEFGQLVFLVSWCGMFSFNNWAAQEGCTDVADCVGEWLSYPVDYFATQTANFPCATQVQPKTAAELAAGWQALMGTVAWEDFRAAIYNTETGAWSLPIPGCEGTCWGYGGGIGAGCLENYAGDPPYEYAISPDGNSYSAMTVGLACSLWGLWYDGISCS
jgi:hypothetical protein